MLKISKVNDATDIFKVILDYILERCPKRYSTVEEAKADVNKKFANVMKVAQDNYNRWFDTELFSNLGAYGIEIIGGNDVVIEENDSVDESNDLYPEDDKGGEEVGSDFFDEPNQDSPDVPQNVPDSSNKPV